MLVLCQNQSDVRKEIKMEIQKPLSWTERAAGVSPMPGGYTGYLDSLRDICVCVEKGNLSFEDLVRFSCDKFEIAESSARIRLTFLHKAGLLHQGDGIVFVSELIQKWTRLGEDFIPVSIIHSKIKFIGEMLGELEEPKSIDDLRKVALHYGLDWQRNTQVLNRRGWLQSANLIQGTSNLLRLTESGRELLSQLKIHVPGEIVDKLPEQGTKHVSTISEIGSYESRAIASADLLADEIVIASTDSANPSRFERLVRDAFLQLGFIAKHLGGQGSTDVLLTAPLGKDDSFSVAIDTKTTASGSLSDNQVDWQTLKEHRAKHEANYSLLVAPNPVGSRLMNRAQVFSVAVLSSDQLAELVRRHASTPLSLVDYEKLFAMLGEIDLGAIDEATEHFVRLQCVASLISRELIEKTNRFGRMSARDVHMAFGEEARGVSQDDIHSLLQMLSHPLVGVVYGYRKSGADNTSSDFVLATSRGSYTHNIRLLADRVSNAKT